MSTDLIKFDLAKTFLMILQSCNSLIHLLKTDYKLLEHLAALRVRCYTG